MMTKSTRHSPANWRRCLMPITATVKEAIQNLDEVALRIILVIDEADRLLGTLSDGDIRRGLLKGVTLDSPISAILHRGAIVVPATMPRESVLQLMAANSVMQVPIVDEAQRVLGLHVWDELTLPSSRSNRVVVMAGGKGTRLRPYTENCPKPLVTVAGKPILEHIIERAKMEGFTEFTFAVHHLGHMIEEHFGDGERLGVNIEYLREPMPLGTAGALSLLVPSPEQAFIVINGDVMTDIRFGDLLDFHARHDAVATMAVRVHEWQHPFGVVHTRGVDIIGFEEKPVARTHINAGVYVLAPEALSAIERDVAFDMPALFESLQRGARRVIAYPMHEPWLDVGYPADLERAQNSVSSEGAMQ